MITYDKCPTTCGCLMQVVVVAETATREAFCIAFALHWEAMCLCISYQSSHCHGIVPIYRCYGRVYIVAFLKNDVTSGFLTEVASFLEKNVGILLPLTVLFSDVATKESTLLYYAASCDYICPIVTF